MLSKQDLNDWYARREKDIQLENEYHSVCLKIQRQIKNNSNVEFTNQDFLDNWEIHLWSNRAGIDLSESIDDHQHNTDNLNPPRTKMYLYRFSFCILSSEFYSFNINRQCQLLKDKRKIKHETITSYLTFINLEKAIILFLFSIKIILRYIIIGLI